MQTEQRQDHGTPFDKLGYEFFGYTPFQHQVVSVLTYLKYKRCYNLSDMGAGKTASTIWAYDILRYMGKVDNMLIICPLSIIQTVWVNEVRKVAPHLTYAIMHGARDIRMEALNSKADIVITNHDCVRNYKSEIIAKKFDIIAIDEITAYKHSSSQRSKCMAKITGYCKVVWGLTGTPITTGPMDAYGLAKIVNPDRLPSPYMTRFRNLTMSKIDMYNYEPRPGWEDIVFNLLQPAIRFKTRDCIDMPPVSFETRVVPMLPEVKKIYNTMVKEHLAEINNGTITAVNAGVKASKLLQIASGSVIDEEGVAQRLPVSPKYNELKSLVYESGNKLVVFVQFVDTALYLDELLMKDQFTTRVIYGKIPVRLRDEYFDEFQNGDVEILIAQVATASHGVNLTAASHICYWSAITGVEKYIQSTARVSRPGQTRHQHIIHLQSCRVEQVLFKGLQDGTLDNNAILDMYKEL